MWMGTYTLDLYCDRAGPSDAYKDDGAGGLTDVHGHTWNEFPRTYTHESGSKARTRARKAGWILQRNGDAICPKCSGKRKFPNMELRGATDEPKQ